MRFVTSCLALFLALNANAGVFDGQPVNATITNAAFLSKNVNDTDTAILGLANSVPSSGTAITNLQAEVNSCSSYTGKAVNSSYNVTPAWTNNDYGSPTDSLFTRADLTTGKFNATTGHTHTGAAGDAPQLPLSTSVTGILQPGNGGTGLTAPALYSLFYGNGASPFGLISPGSQYNVLVAGVAGLPAFGQVALNQSAAVTGALAIGNGGTGQTTKAAAFDALSPTTTKGDLIAYDTGTNVRVPVGTNGQFLSADNTQASGLKWISAGPGTVTSVNVTSSNQLSTSGGPVTTSGSIAINQAYQFQPARNILLNSNFAWWQAGTSFTGLANGTSTYGPDQVYARNALGTGGVMSFTQQTASLTGSEFAAKVLVTTAAASPTVSPEIYMILDNRDTITNVYNQTVSYGVSVKAFGNVNQVGMQLVYMTSSAKCDGSNTIGSESTASVSTGSYTAMSFAGQPAGTSMTTSGVVCLRIRATGVSSGSLGALNNGFQIEQPFLNAGSQNTTWTLRTGSERSELQVLQTYYEKSYDTLTDPGTVTVIGALQVTAYGASPSPYMNAQFKATKRTDPTVTVYSPGTGTSGNVRNITDATDTAATVVNIGQNGFSVGPTAATNNKQYSVQWVADARI